MAGKINIYQFGLGGVNLSKQPLQLADDEATQLQNVELVPDNTIGGYGALTKRGGLQALTSALSGSVTGMKGVPLAGTYTRTLYAARGTATSDTFVSSTNGTSWTAGSTLSAPASIAKYVDAVDTLSARRMVSFRNFVLFPGNGYTKDTDNPIVIIWDGTTSSTMTEIRPSPEASGPPYTIVDMLTADGVVWIATHEPGDAAPNNNGRVMSLDVETGELLQACEPFGTGAGLQQTGGAPSALCFFQNQIWVGQNHQSTTDAIGKISRCYPFVDTQWSTDTSGTLSGSISSLASFGGQLYAGTQSSVSSAEKVYVRSASANTYAASLTGIGAGANGHMASLIVYNSELYCVDYHETAPTIHIKKFDGSSWSTDRDVDATDSGVAGNTPGGAVILGSDLYFVFRATTATATDGFIMRRSSGTWTKVYTGNLAGQIGVLVTRS